MHLSGHRSSDLYIIFFLIILLAAFAPSLKQTIALSVLLCLGYGFVLYSSVEGFGSLSESHFLRFPLLLIIGTFYGHSLDLLRQERQAMWALRQRQQATEAAYQESVERLDLVLNQAHDAVFFVEPTGVIRWCNRQAMAITGQAKEHLIGQSLVTLLSPESARAMEERLATVEAGERVRPPLEVQLARADGATAWLEVNATVIAPSRDMTGRLLLARDITERKRAVEENSSSKRSFGRRTSWKRWANWPAASPTTSTTSSQSSSATASSSPRTCPATTPASSMWSRFGRRRRRRQP
ncbi:PAS domain-containing protein [Nitrospira sp. Kam-Ns4a]